MALTYELEDARSPVTEWLRRSFPHHRELQKAYRQDAGRILAPLVPGSTPGTVGAAFDLMLRLRLDPAPDLAIAYEGLVRCGVGTPFFRPGARLLYRLGAIDHAGDRPGPRPVDPARVADWSPSLLARCCYALALLVELLRSRPERLRKSPLFGVRPDADPRALLALAPEAAVADLLALCDVAAERLEPALAGATVRTGPTFAGSAAIGGADADLIADGLLLDLKTSQGRKRSDGSRALSLDRVDLDQLLGYVLLDVVDEYALNRVGFYSARFGRLTVWDLSALLAELAGRPVDLAATRAEFHTLLRTELPAYHERRQERAIA